MSDFVEIGTDYIGRCDSNYHTITAMMTTLPHLLTYCLKIRYSTWWFLLLIHINIMKAVLDTFLCDKVCQWPTYYWNVASNIHNPYVNTTLTKTSYCYDQFYFQFLCRCDSNYHTITAMMTTLPHLLTYCLKIRYSTWWFLLLIHINIIYVFPLYSRYLLNPILLCLGCQRVNEKTTPGKLYLIHFYVIKFVSDRHITEM
jgi:hypothetical protein